MNCIHGVQIDQPCEYCAFSSHTLTLLIRCRKLLKELEWDATLHDGPGCYTLGCPSCGAAEYSQTHASDCELAALLREIKT